MPVRTRRGMPDCPKTERERDPQWLAGATTGFESRCWPKKEVTMTLRTTTNDDCGLCDALALPIRECPRDDIVSWEVKDGNNLWCCACGHFWQGSPGDVAAAQRRFEEEP